MIQVKIFDATDWRTLEADINQFMRAQVRKLITAQYSTYCQGEQIHYTAMIIYD